MYNFKSVPVKYFIVFFMLFSFCWATPKHGACAEDHGNFSKKPISISEHEIVRSKSVHAMPSIRYVTADSCLFVTI